MHKLEDKYVDEMSAAIVELNKVGEQIEVKRDEMSDKMAEFNQIMQNYNNMLKNADAVRDKVIEAMHNFLDNQPTAWVDGEAGAKYLAWRDKWQEIDLSEVPLLDDPELIDLFHAAELEDLPYEPED